MPPVSGKKRGKGIDGPAHRAAAREAAKIAAKEAAKTPVMGSKTGLELAHQFLQEAAANLKPELAQAREYIKETAEKIAQPTRHVRWLWVHDSKMFGVLKITHDTTSWQYFVRRLSLQVFQLEKLEPGRPVTYTVTINGTSNCGCLSHANNRNEKCKHISALESLKSKGKLIEPMMPVTPVTPVK